MTSIKLLEPRPRRSLPVLQVAGFGGVLLLFQIVTFVLFADVLGPARIAFMSNRDGNYEIYIMDSDGSAVTNLTNDPSTDGLPSWSDEARALAFLTTRDEQSISLYRMDDAGLELELIVQDPTLVPSTPIWSPDGEMVIYHNGDTQQVNIQIADTSGKIMREISTGSSLNQFADWSPDGEQFIFLSDREGQSAVYIQDDLQGEPVALTDPQFASAMAVWSPDGEQIAFVTDRDGDVEIYVIGLESSESTRLTDSPGFDLYPKWSPDGTKIAFISMRDGDPEIYVMNSDGTNPVNLTRNSAQDSIDGDFSWSADGTQILFHSDRDGNPEVYLMNADGSNPVNLSNDPATDVGAIWVE
jgi:Tol biopolymer transport system component